MPAASACAYSLVPAPKSTPRRPTGRLVFGIFASLAEFERELIAERTRAGLAAARARGRLGGRPRKMDVAMLRMAMRAMADRDTNAHGLAQRLGIHHDDPVHVRQRRRHGKGTGPEAARRGPGRMSQDGGIPAEALLDLRRRRDQLPPRHATRRALVESAAGLFGVSRATLYRALAGQLQPRGLRRADRGEPRKISRRELERYCELVAALKLRTSNLKGRRLSTSRCIELLETHGVETPQGLVQAPGGLLHRATVNRYLQLWGYDHARMTRAPAAVRFEARTANALWQFDISPSDLKAIEQPTWIDPDRKGLPVPMLFSVVDDRSGAAYQEYRCVYGEDVESGLRFLFNAMAPKKDADHALQGIPEALYLDNGPIAKSGVFNTVMERLGVRVMTHVPAGRDGRRPTARAKGKVERPFRTGEGRRTRRSITSTSPRPKLRRMPGFHAISTATTRSRTAESRIAASRTGRATCLVRVCGRCVPGNASAPLRANPSAAA